MLLLPVILGFLVASCSDRSEPEPPVPPTDRTVLVYMVAANNLGSHDYDRNDIEEMQEAALAGHFGNSRLLVYHCPYNGEVQLKEIKSDGSVSVLKTYPVSSNASVTVERMRQVISDMKAVAPALDYGLVLWSHANGWLVDGVNESDQRSGVHYSYGVDGGKKMNISSLRDALTGAGFSFIYIDCCYMGGIEVMYDLRNVAKTAVASAAEVALPGMPYHLSLRYLMSPTPDPVQAARTTYEYYESQDTQFDRSCTIAVVDLTAVDALAAATRRVYAQAETPVPAGYVKHPFSPEKRNYFDFADYVEALAGSDTDLRDSWRSAFDKAVIYKAQTDYFQINVNLSVHCGLSTFIFEDESQTTTNGYYKTSWYADVASALIK